MKKNLKRMLACLMLIAIFLGSAPITGNDWFTTKASAVTFSELNSSEVFLKQAGSTTCTLCSATMMLRRYSMLRGDSGWRSITESAVRPVAWVNGAGLRYSFTYSNSSVSAISVATYTLPGGSANESIIQNELKKCPEGIVIYNTSVPHAVLLTDYTNGTYYCADPYSGVASGRIPLTSSYKVRITNVTQYWKVTSPIVPGPTDEHVHNYTGQRVYEPEHPHRISQRCVDYATCEGFYWTNEYYTDHSCTQCCDSATYTLTCSPSSVTMKVGETKTVKFTESSSGFVVRIGGKADMNMVSAQFGNWEDSCKIPLTITALKPGNTTIYVDLIADLTGKVMKTYQLPVTITTDSYTLSYNANGGSGAPSSQTGAKSYTVSSTVPTRFGYIFKGWSKSSSATSASYKPGDTINLSANTTLYAVWESARSASAGAVFGCDIGFSDQQLYFKFTPSSSGKYILKSTANFDARVYLYNSSGTEIAKDDDSGEGRNFSLEYYFTAGKTYYIKINGFGSAKGSGTFSLKHVTYMVSYNANGGSNAPSSQTKYDGTDLMISATVPKRNGYTFRGWATSSTAKTASYQPKDQYRADSSVTLYAVWEHIHTYTTTTTKSATCTQSGIRTSKCSCGSSYTVTISALGHSYSSSWTVDKPATCTTPGSKSHHCVRCGAKASETVIQATGHSFGEWKTTKITTCTSEGLQTRTCSVCNATETRTLNVREHDYESVIKRCASFSSDGVTADRCAVCGEERNSRSIPGVSQVYLSATKFTYDGEIKTPAVTIKNSENETLKKGTNYTVSYASGRTNPGRYAVTVTLKGKYAGTKTLYFDILPSVTSKITATQTTNAIKLTWNAVSKATGYKVYLYNTKTKKYQSLSTTTKNTYTVTKLTEGTDYIFAVRAYSTVDGKVFWASGFKTIATATKPNTPTLKANAGTGTATLSWNKQAGADGYVIYMATSKNGKYTKIATINGNSKVNYTKTGLTKGKIYYFKVAAYETAGGKNIYSSLSSVRSVKIK